LFYLGGVFAGVVSDYLGGRALTCMVMLLLAAPSVSLAGRSIDFKLFDLYCCQLLG